MLFTIYCFRICELQIVPNSFVFNTIMVLGKMVYFFWYSLSVNKCSKLQQKSIDVKFGNDDHYCVIEYSLWLKQPVVMKYITWHTFSCAIQKIQAPQNSRYIIREMKLYLSTLDRMEMNVSVINKNFVFRLLA